MVAALLPKVVVHRVTAKIQIVSPTTGIVGVNDKSFAVEIFIIYTPLFPQVFVLAHYYFHYLVKILKASFAREGELFTINRNGPSVYSKIVGCMHNIL